MTGANLDPRDIVGRISNVNTRHSYILNIQTVVLMVSEKFFYLVFPISIWELIYPQGVASLDPRGINGRIYVGKH